MTNQSSEHPDVLEDPDGARWGLRSGGSQLLQSWRTAGIAIPFLLLFVTLSITSAPFLHTTNLINILDQQAATLCIAAAGTLVLVAGGIDLSVGATYGLSTVVAGEIAAHHSPVLAIVAAILVGLFVGLVNGLIVTVFKINALITTLAMSFVIGGLALKVSGGNLIVLSANSGFFKFANAQFLTVPSAVWMTLFFVVVRREHGRVARLDAEVATAFDVKAVDVGGGVAHRVHAVIVFLDRLFLQRAPVRRDLVAVARELVSGTERFLREREILVARLAGIFDDVDSRAKDKRVRIADRRLLDARHPRLDVL